jgi:hypothetical protein
LLVAETPQVSDNADHEQVHIDRDRHRTITIGQSLLR